MEHPFAPLPALEPESEAYWTACREGRLEMTRCRACCWFVHPSRPVCSRCRSRDVAPQTLSGLGTVITYTVNHQRWMPGLEVPYVIAIVELVEQQNLRLTTNIVGCPPEAVRVGMPVKVRFRRVSDEISLPIFEPDDAPRPDVAALRTTPDTPPKHTDTAEVLAHPPRRVAPEERLERRAILSGVGQSAIGRRLFRTDMDLTVEAALRAIADAGLTPDDVDGIAAYPGAMGAGPPGFAGPGIVEVQDALGLSVNWYLAGIEVPGQIGPVISA
ncbi:MAG TPA: OB-fold domain-containing protein, partial [Candidatus Binatia bacterium]|nr:OB-fold domain-containing protein [Candidatus Binatia bacterium]